MKYTYQRAITVTVQDTYGYDNPPIPEGYESTGEFQPPRKGDLYLHAHIEGRVKEALIDWDQSDPRIILRKKKIKRIIYTQVRTGTPQPGEYYQSLTEDGTQMFRYNPGNQAYLKQNHPNVPIFKREEEEI